MNVEASAPFEAAYNAGETGLVPGLEVAIEDNDGNTVYGPTSTGIAEILVGGQPTGSYAAQIPAAPATLGQYTILFSNDGSFDPDAGGAIDDLVVVAVGETGELPPIAAPDDGGPQMGPCSAWTTTDDIAACCTEVESGSDPDPFFEVARDEASQVLHELSGRIFSGLCQNTVRPCAVGCGCSMQVLSRGHVVIEPSWSGLGWQCDGRPCGCSGLSTVKLPGYPVREIVQVKIDGDIVDPDTYRLDGYRYLVRVRDPAEPETALRWPSCQMLDLPDTADGTFSVTYTYGQNPPLAGQHAARELACEIAKQCAGGECKLPTGVSQITRQGVRFDRAFFRIDPNTGAWRTGMAAVDAFLNAYNPNGLARRPMISSPTSRARYARIVGA